MSHRVQLAVVFLATATLWGQANTASIRGIVNDPSGAVVPDSTVTLVNTGTGVQTTTKTNPSGEYLFEFLPPGSYRVEVRATGFKTFTRENIVLELARQLRIDIPLETGLVTETVNVAAQVPLVETENGALGTTVQNQMVTGLPLLSRNPQNLVLLGAGVVQTTDGNITNGGLVRIDPYYIDGADSSNHVWSGTPVNPNPDVINEFRALTNAYSAEYGESSGVTMIATTKSGTNQYHGTAFEFLQNDALNAGNYFTHSVPVLRYNQFGGTFGGPIKKDKLFFFIDTQITRQTNPVAITNITVPTAAMRAGDFSSLLGGPVGTDALGNTLLKYQIFNPFSQRQVTTPSGATVWIRDPFPGNKIPADLISPAAKLIQALYPAPLVDQSFNNFSVNGAATAANNEWDAKVDYAINDLDRLTVRYSEKRRFTQQASAFGYGAGGGPIPGTLGPGNTVASPGRQAVVNYVHVFSPTATNDLNVAWQNQFPRRVIPGYGQISNLDLGIKGMPNAGQKLGTPYFNFTNFEALGATTDTTFQEWQTQETLTDTFSWNRGRHNLRMGGWIRKLLTNNLQPGALNTAWTFNNVFTNQPGNNNTGFDYASFLLGLPSAMTYSIFPDYFRTRANLYAAFVQDDFHVSRNLTLNVGVRWDAPNFYHEAQNRSGVFDLNQGQYVQFGANGFRTTPWNNDWHNVNPRFGFAYNALGGKAVHSRRLWHFPGRRQQRWCFRIHAVITDLRRLRPGPLYDDGPDPLADHAGQHSLSANRSNRPKFEKRKRFPVRQPACLHSAVQLQHPNAVEDDLVPGWLRWYAGLASNVRVVQQQCDSGCSGARGKGPVRCAIRAVPSVSARRDDQLLDWIFRLQRASVEGGETLLPRTGIRRQLYPFEIHRRRQCRVPRSGGKSKSRSGVVTLQCAEPHRSRVQLSNSVRSGASMAESRSSRPCHWRLGVQRHNDLPEWTLTIAKSRDEHLRLRK